MLTQDQQIIEQIKKANNILITFGRTWNGDAVASALAIYLFLKKMDKKATIAADKFDQGKLFSFLPGYASIKHSLKNIRNFVISLSLNKAKVEKVKYEIKNNALSFIITPKEGTFSHNDISSDYRGFTFDLIIVLDTPDLESLGKIYDNDAEFFYNTPILNIDHHADNEAFGQINQIELTSVATAEILFNLFASYSRDLIDEDIATCLLTGIIAKTKSFKTKNITPQALSAVSQLISMGGRREEIVDTLYRSRALNVLKLWGRVLARLNSDLDNKLVWSVLAKMDFEKTGTTENDLNEVVDELIINIPEAKVIALIYESENGEQNAVKALIYSVKNTNSLELAKNWSPEGVKSMAKITIKKPLPETEQEIIDHLKAQLNKLPI